MPASAKIITLYPARLEPTREQDEQFLDILNENPDLVSYNEAGEPVLADTPPVAFVSEYLTRPLRTEDEARAQLNRPRIPRAKGLLEMIAEQSGIDAAFRKLFGG